MTQPAVLVINAGSSSLKYALLDPLSGDRVAGGGITGIAEQRATITHDATSTCAEESTETSIVDHEQALIEVVRWLTLATDVQPSAVGHRVVHGGKNFSTPVVITEEVVAAISACIPLAPLHNPACLAGIDAAVAAFPDVVQVAVFDTAFHATMPKVAHEYAIDREVAAQFQIRRYGFHGTSHQYVSARAAAFLKIPLTEFNAVSLHLGNGASACAIRSGRSIDTSMGVTPLEGLVMGSRSGDIDASVPTMLIRAGYTVDEVDTLLNRKSGLLGLAGVNDMRELHRRATNSDDAARLAQDLFVYRVRKYVGAYMFALGRVDALMFTAGIGEHDSWVRQSVCVDSTRFGLELDPIANESVHLTGPGEVAVISSPEAPVPIMVVATDEEHAIAEQAWNLLRLR